MVIRKILIFAPILLMAFLIQSYFWVPTYDQQTRGNPDRLNEFITASIGDASILNPILASDSASSDIAGLVFEGLLDRDEELRFRGRVAASWSIMEEAFFYVNERRSIPGMESPDAEGVVSLLQKARKGDLPISDEARASLENVREISIIPPRSYSVSKPIKGVTKDGRAEEVEFQVKAPARIRLVLGKVDQDLFKNIESILGKGYFTAFSPEDYITPVQRQPAPVPRSALEALLPATEHNPIIIFHLRPRVMFHDGHELDAYDVKFTYDSIMDPKNLSPRISDYEPVKQVDILDPLTVRITYKRLYSPALGTWAMGILPEHLLNAKALGEEARRLQKDPEKFSLRQSGFNRHPVGCGPFVFQEWRSDQYIALKRFDRYWEGPPNYKGYIYRIIPDLLTQEMEFYAGTIDTYGVQPHQVHRLENDPRYQGFSGLSFGYTYIGYNMRRGLFQDRRVRLALGMAIDVEKIIKYVLYGQGERITGPFVKQSDYYDHGIRPIPYDPEGALRLLKEAGWRPNSEGWLEKDGKRFQFTLITNSGNDLRKAVLAIAQDAWRRIGIDVRTDLLEWSVFIQERVDKGDFDAVVLGWSMGIEPDLYQIWHSSQTNPHQLNFVGFKNPQADDLIIKIRQEYDYDRQVKDCHQLHEIIAREQPYTFLYVGKWTAILDKRIVIKETDSQGKAVYKRIKPTKTGNYTFYFNKWIKLPEAPTFSTEG